MILILFTDAFRGGILLTTEKEINAELASNFGEFVGGFFGSLFALMSVGLLVLTFQAQRDFSDKQSFETKYFELIKMHRDNVAELEVDEVVGKKIFVVMIREFRALLDVVKSTTEKCNIELTLEELIGITYFCFYFGVGPNSSRMLKDALELSYTNKDHNFFAELIKELENEDNQKIAKIKKRLTFTPFGGHQSRLGHYFRHLYQC